MSNLSFRCLALRGLSRQLRPSSDSLRSTPRYAPLRCFHASRSVFAVKPFLLADIGEGITEVQIIQWFVQPGARVEQFDKLCEVQSDKASVEITSRFDGVIKKLHYDADDMAVVGKPLVDIDIENELSDADEAATTATEEQSGGESASSDTQNESQQTDQSVEAKTGQESAQNAAASQGASSSASASSGKEAKLATPAVRHLTRELDVDIADIPGTGKDGRVMKEDVKRFADGTPSSAKQSRETPAQAADAEDQTISLTPVQNQMFKTMTRSINIPHFLYTDSIDVTALTALRQTINASAPSREERISLLPFLIKAVSLALTEFPLLNARLDTTTNPQKPQLVLRGAHNIGIAVDSPQGLLVPVIRSAQTLSVEGISAEARRLSGLAREGKLKSNDMSGGTFSVSNVGSIGGGVVAPVIVDSQLAIVGLGRTKTVPAFNEEGDVIRREECTLSWSADHRVVDGATVARCAELVRKYIETPETMLMKLR